MLRICNMFSFASLLGRKGLLRCCANVVWERYTRVAISCLPVMCETGYCRASVITGLNYWTRLLDINAVAVCTPHNIQQLRNLISRMPCSTFMRLHMTSQASSAGDCWWARHYLCLIPVLSFHSYDTNFDLYVSLLISWYKLFKETPSFLAMFLIHTLKFTRMYMFKKCANAFLL